MARSSSTTAELSGGKVPRLFTPAELKPEPSRHAPESRPITRVLAPRARRTVPSPDDGHTRPCYTVSSPTDRLLMGTVVLSDRTRRVLAMLVREYIETGEPVESAPLMHPAG